jgi:LuxR family maltose regulon positive regulatory protein
VPLDQPGKWYRYHHMFRDMLVAELQRREPELIPALRRRAASWCLHHGFPEEALEYARAAEEVDTVAGLVEQLLVPAYRQGRVATVQRWSDWLETRRGIQGHPMVMVLASLVAALTARPVDAERWADAVDRWQYGEVAGPVDPSAAAWAALLRAILCRHGIERMRADADEAARRFAAGSFVTPAPVLMQGLAAVLSGDPDSGDEALTVATAIAEHVDSLDDLVVALCERALVAMARGDCDQAGALAGQARAALHRAGIEEGYTAALVCVVQARTAQHRGDLPAVRREWVAAQRLRHTLTYALPHLAVQARIELARVNLAHADIAGAKTLMREVDELLVRRPHLGTLVDEARALQAQLSSQPSPAAPGVSSLTAAELRLLPLLPTHLSFPEIAEHMFLSHNTIKAEVNSVYRKLGASTRSQAIARARDVGLLET